MKKRRDLWLSFCLLAIVVHPLLTSWYYNFMLDHGAYRTDADSIAIPIAGNFFAWVIWAPILGTICWLVFRRFQPPLRLLTWDGRMRWKSALVSVACAAAVVVSAMPIRDAVRWRNWTEVVYSMWWVAFWFVLRAAALTQSPNKSPETNALQGQ